MLPLHTAIALSVHRTCSAQGCSLPRHPGQAGAFCTVHRKRRLEVGHELGTKVSLTETRRHRRYVARLLNTGTNWKRDAVVEALGRLDELISTAAFEGGSCGPYGTRRQKMLRGLHRTVCVKGVRSKSLLVNVVALMLYLRANPHLRPPTTSHSDGDRWERFTVGRCVVFTNGPKKRGKAAHVGSQALETIGSTVQEIVAKVLAMVVIAHEASKRRASDQSRPFDPVVIGRPRKPQPRVPT
jgi:hypothetical protein